MKIPIKRIKVKNKKMKARIFTQEDKKHLEIFNYAMKDSHLKGVKLGVDDLLPEPREVKIDATIQNKEALEEFAAGKKDYAVMTAGDKNYFSIHGNKLGQGIINDTGMPHERIIAGLIRNGKIPMGDYDVISCYIASNKSINNSLISKDTLRLVDSPEFLENISDKYFKVKGIGDFERQVGVYWDRNSLHQTGELQIESGFRKHFSEQLAKAKSEYGLSMNPVDPNRGFNFNGMDLFIARTKDIFSSVRKTMLDDLPIIRTVKKPKTRKL